MKKRFALLISVMAVGVLLSGEDSAVDLYAGWNWSPFSYADYPYRYGGYPLGGPWPRVGVAFPLSGRDDMRHYYPYGYDGYDPFWGYEYGVRLRLRNSREIPALSENLLPPPPGSVPLETRDPQRDRHWESEIEPFLGTLYPEWQKQLQTNSVPQENRIKP